jgi:hypothetical protein
MSTDLLQAVISVLIAGAGALARLLNQPNDNSVPFFRTLSSCFIAMFAGILVHFIADYLQADSHLSYVLAGLSGWIGPQSLEAIVSMVSKKIGVKLPTKPEETEGAESTENSKNTEATGTTESTESTAVAESIESAESTETAKSTESTATTEIK